MLELKDVHVEVNGVEIIKGISLKFYPGKVHVLMGPNGSGKSTLANAIMGHPRYKITNGKIELNGKDITNVKPNVKAKKGIFLSFQYPQEVAGVTIGNFLRTAYNTVKEKKVSIMDFHKLLKQKMEELHIDPKFSQRELNVGFSGGEKKRTEMLQLSVLEPKYAFMDETDSGLDVDSIKIVAEGINRIRKKENTALIVITHYNKFLDYLQPDEVSIVYDGRIVRQGDYTLAKEIEEHGFGVVRDD